MFGHIGSLHIETLPNLSLENWKANNLIINRKIKLLFGSIIVSPIQKCELSIFFNSNFLLMKHKSIGLVQCKLTFGYLKHLNLILLIFDNMCIACHLIACPLIHVKEFNFLTIINYYNSAHMWKHIKSAYPIFWLNIECFDLKTIADFDQCDDGDKFLISRDIE